MCYFSKLYVDGKEMLPGFVAVFEATVLPLCPTFSSTVLVFQCVTIHCSVLLLQDNLLLYNHAKLMAEDNHSSGKEYLVSIMFSHYDQNNNGALEREELEQVCGMVAVWSHVTSP
jgi:hypothetical protein